MRTIALTIAAALISWAFGGVLMADTPTEVVVTSSRVITTETGQMPGGTPIVAASLSYTVSAKGLDLASPDGKAKFEKAVTKAAWKACEALHRQFPGSIPPLHECVHQAKDDAMPKVRELEAQAGNLSK